MSIADKLTTIAENQEKVYEAGKQEGNQAEYDEYWDYIQKNGTLTSYNYAFCGFTWNAKNFKPKYPMQVTSANHMFWCFSRADFVEKADLSQFNIDFSKCTNLTSTFQNAHLISTGFVDCSSAGNLKDTFNCNNWGGLQKIHVKVIETNTFSSTFAYNYDTTEIIFSDDSVIAANGLNVQWSTKLSKESIISIINALSPNTSGLTVTISKTAKQNAFTDEEWATLIATKPNWTISLA